MLFVSLVVTPQLYYSVEHSIGRTKPTNGCMHVLLDVLSMTCHILTHQHNILRTSYRGATSSARSLEDLGRVGDPMMASINGYMH